MLVLSTLVHDARGQPSRCKSHERRFAGSWLLGERIRANHRKLERNRQRRARAACGSARPPLPSHAALRHPQTPACQSRYVGRSQERVSFRHAGRRSSIVVPTLVDCLTLGQLNYRVSLRASLLFFVRWNFDRQENESLVIYYGYRSYQIF